MSLDIWLKIDVDTGGDHPVDITLYDDNYTHNVTPMWRKAGVFEALYKSNGKQAGEILDVLDCGIEHMISHADEYEELNPSNEWGSYEGALWFLKSFASACHRHPNAIIGVWS